MFVKMLQIVKNCGSLAGPSEEMLKDCKDSGKEEAEKVAVCIVRVDGRHTTLWLISPIKILSF